MLRFHLRASTTSCARATWCSAISSACSAYRRRIIPTATKVSSSIRRSAPRCSRTPASAWSASPTTCTTASRSTPRSRSSTASASCTPAPGKILQRRARRRSSSARGVRFGFVQRSSVYWPTNHEARKDAVGIAVIKGHTAYQIPTSRLKPDSFPPNRPGCRRRSSPGRTRPISRNSRRTSPRCVRRSTCWSRHVTGASATTCCNT